MFRTAADFQNLQPAPLTSKRDAEPFGKKDLPQPHGCGRSQYFILWDIAGMADTNHGYDTVTR